MTTLRASCSCTSAVLLRAGAVVCASCGAPIPLATTPLTSPRPYSQRDGERPAGCGRVRFLRIWKRAKDANDPGATADGRARVLTPEAYARHAVASDRSDVGPKRSVKATREAEVDAAVREQLGATRRTG